MPEDDSTKHAPDGAATAAEKPASDKSQHEEKRPEKRRSWLERISSAISGEPDNQEDLVELLRDLHADGVIDSDTLRMMEGTLAVSDLTVSDVMVPRSQMVVLPVDDKFLSLMKQVVESGHSRFPVHGEDRDEILGILLAKDLLRGVVADNGPGTVRELLRPAVLVPESKRLDILLREFRQSRNHMAIVIDEYGGVAGLVTIEDVLEQIVGKIDDEHDDAEDPNALIAAQADGQYLVDALDADRRFQCAFRRRFRRRRIRHGRRAHHRGDRSSAGGRRRTHPGSFRFPRRARRRAPAAYLACERACRLKSGGIARCCI